MLNLYIINIQVRFIKTNTPYLLNMISVILLIFALSCNDTKESGVPESPYSLKTGQIFDAGGKDSIVHADSAIVDGQLYSAFYTNKDEFCLLNAKGKTVFQSHGLTENFLFEDFNRDGFKDIKVKQLSVMGDMFDLILYDKNDSSFHRVDGFSDYTNSRRIGNTKYLYSFMSPNWTREDWFSCLYYVENFKTIKIGEIERWAGEDSVKMKGIYIRISKSDRDSLINKLPLAAIPEDGDYSFISQYWKRNYKKFTTLYKP